MKYIKFFALPILLIAIFASSNILFADNMVTATKEEVTTKGKVAISVGQNIEVEGEDDVKIKAKVSKRFSRCPFFILLSIENGKINRDKIIILKNKASKKKDLVGEEVAAKLAKHKVKAVITLNMGKKTYDELEKADIAVYQAPEKSIQKAIKDFNQKRLEKFIPKEKSTKQE